MPPNQKLWETQLTPGGWYRGTAELRRMLVKAGLPPKAPGNRKGVERRIGVTSSLITTKPQAGASRQSVITTSPVTIITNGTRTKTGGSHVLTGPVYVDGAEPGDTLEVRIINIKARVSWGYNTQGSGGRFRIT